MSSNKETLTIYLHESLKFRTHLFVSLALVPLSAILIGVAVPFFLSRIIELLSHGERLGDAEFTAMIYTTVGVSLAAVVINRIAHIHLLKLDYKVRAQLQQRAFHSLLHKSYRFYADHKVGSLTSHFIGFVGAYSRINQIVISEALTLALSLLAGIIIIFIHSVILGSTLLVITVLIFTLAYFGVKKRAPFRKKRKQIISELHGAIADDIGNNAVIKMFGKESYEEKVITKKITELKHVFSKDFMLLAREGNLRHTIMLSFQLVVIIIAAWLLQQGAISLGVVIFSLTYLIRLSANLFTIGPIINGFEQSMVEAAPMTDILLEENDVQDKAGAKNLAVKRGKINFNHITFRYEDDTNHVFTDLNLQIAAGEKIGLVGTSGGGKTTVTKLLLRFLDIQKGTITIDDQDIAKVTQQSLRENIAFVPQEPLLFHRSLRENIAYAKPDASYTEIQEAARKARATEFIETLPKGYDTTVGERGVKLSGGQKQRIAIARAILADAPILVLDEATSALDSESEKAIQAALANLMKHKTTIVIAHRLSTIQKMDRIIVLDDGKIVEEGSHQTLLAKNGKYATLWAHQTGSFIEE